MFSFVVPVRDEHARGMVPRGGTRVFLSRRFGRDWGGLDRGRIQTRVNGTCFLACSGIDSPLGPSRLIHGD
jgi:hypothetical protein